LDKRNFVVEKLYKGSVINFRTFFMDNDESMVQLVCSKASIIQVLSYAKMEKLCEKYSELNEKFSKYRLNIILNYRRIALDYIMVLP